MDRAHKENEVDTVEEEEASEVDISIVISGKVTEEEAACESQEKSSANEDIKVNDVREQPLPQEEEVVFELNSSNDDEGPSKLHLDTPERETINYAQKDEEEEEEADDNKKYKEHLQLLQELSEERDKAIGHNRQMQAKLLEYFYQNQNRGVENSNRPMAELQKDFDRHMAAVAELKQQINMQSVKYQEQIEQLRLQSEETQDKAEKEWQALVAHKKDVVMKTLTQSMSKQAAQAKVESALAIEQLHHDELTSQRVYNSRMRIRISKLQMKLRERAQYNNEARQREIEEVQTKIQERQKEAEKQYEESSKLMKKITRNLELLSNVKEKLHWSQDEVRNKQQQLAELEDTLAKKRVLLTQTKQARNKLQRSNQMLKERCGLLMNRILLKDFEDTVDALDHQEEQLKNLKLRQAEASKRKEKL